jgi:hypothetical protein
MGVQIPFRPCNSRVSIRVLHLHRKADWLTRRISNIQGQRAEAAPINSRGGQKELDLRLLRPLKVKLKCIIPVRGKSTDTGDACMRYVDAVQLTWMFEGP